MKRGKEAATSSKVQIWKPIDNYRAAGRGSPLAAVLQSGLAVHQPRARCRLTTARGWSPGPSPSIFFRPARSGPAPHPQEAEDVDRGPSREVARGVTEMASGAAKENGSARERSRHFKGPELHGTRQRATRSRRIWGRQDIYGLRCNWS
jgi:hypothetical protein